MNAKRNWIRGGCIAAAFFMAAVIFLRADAGAGIPLPAPWDKVVHFLYYGTMALLLAHGSGRRWLWMPLVLVPAIGALDEWHQIGIPGREASFFDWLADELGTVAFVAAYWRGMRGRAARLRWIPVSGIPAFDHNRALPIRYEGRGPSREAGGKRQEARGERREARGKRKAVTVVHPYGYTGLSPITA